jgi:hypothetical protein
LYKKKISIFIAVAAFLTAASPAQAFTDARECLGKVPNTSSGGGFVDRDALRGILEKE